MRASTQCTSAVLAALCIGCFHSSILLAKEKPKNTQHWPPTKMSWAKNIRPALEAAIYVRELNDDGDPEYQFMMRNPNDQDILDTRLVESRRILVDHKLEIFALYDARMIYNKAYDTWINERGPDINGMVNFLVKPLDVLHRDICDHIFSDPIVLGIILPPIMKYLSQSNVICSDWPSFEVPVAEPISVGALMPYIASLAFTFQDQEVRTDYFFVIHIEDDFDTNYPSLQCRRAAFSILCLSKPARTRIAMLVKSLDTRTLSVSEQVRHLHRSCLSDPELTKTVVSAMRDPRVMRFVTCTDCNQ